MTHDDAQPLGRLRPYPAESAEIPARVVVDDGRLMRDVGVAFAPLEQSVHLVLAQEAWTTRGCSSGATRTR